MCASISASSALYTSSMTNMRAGVSHRTVDSQRRHARRDARSPLVADQDRPERDLQAGRVAVGPDEAPEREVRPASHLSHRDGKALRRSDTTPLEGLREAERSAAGEFRAAGRAAGRDRGSALRPAIVGPVVPRVLARSRGHSWACCADRSTREPARGRSGRRSSHRRGRRGESHRGRRRQRAARGVREPGLPLPARQPEPP